MLIINNEVWAPEEAAFVFGTLFLFALGIPAIIFNHIHDSIRKKEKKEFLKKFQK